MKKRLQRL
jgi:hypothetical protein